MVQQTSILAYVCDVLPGLGYKQAQVLEAIKDMGSPSDKELAIYLGWGINRVTPRRGELVGMGLVEKGSYKIQNGRKVNTWRIKR